MLDYEFQFDSKRSKNSDNQVYIVLELVYNMTAPLDMGILMFT